MNEYVYHVHLKGKRFVGERIWFWRRKKSIKRKVTLKGVEKEKIVTKLIENEKNKNKEWKKWSGIRIVFRLSWNSANVKKTIEEARRRRKSIWEKALSGSLKNYSFAFIIIMIFLTSFLVFSFFSWISMKLGNR